MADDDQRERDLPELERLLNSGIFRIATDADNFGEPPPTPTVDHSGLGYPLMDALGRFAEDPSDRHRLIAANAWEPPSQSGAGEDFSEELQQYYHLRERLEFDLVRKLISGELTAHWHPESSTSLADIAPSWWIGARLDCRLNEAFSNNTRVTGLWIREPIKAVPSEAEAASPTRDAAKERGSRQPRNWKDADVEAWVKNRVRQFAGSARHPSADDDWEAAKKEFSGIPRKAIRDFRVKYVPAERRPRGPGKSAKPPYYSARLK